jgi:hypothetical protein
MRVDDKRQEYTNVPLPPEIQIKHHDTTYSTNGESKLAAVLKPQNTIK